MSKIRNKIQNKQQTAPVEASSNEEIQRLRHIIGVQKLQYDEDLKNLEKLLSKYRKENASLKAYIKVLVNRNIFQRIRNTQPPYDEL